MARCVAYAAATTQSTSVASGLFERLTASTTGVSASAIPAASPAVRPHTRRTVAITNATEAAPATTDGISIDQVE